MPIIEDELCEGIQEMVYRLPPLKTRICVGAIDSGMGATGGDSGGPLVCKNNKNEEFLYGIASVAAEPFGTLPALFTRISTFIPWIHEKIDDYMKNKHQHVEFRLNPITSMEETPVKFENVSKFLA